jgi:predicted ATPase
VYWVPLAQIEDPAVVGQTIATRLGVPDTPGQDAAEAVAGQIADHPVLVVLDNCEHLAATAADVAEYLLEACPALVVLATSREALGVEGELSWQVPPLSLPKAEPRPPRRRSPDPTRSSCSNSERSWCDRHSGSRTRTPRRS